MEHKTADQTVLYEIREMERCFDILCGITPEQLRDSPELQKLLKDLKCYFESGRWLRHYIMDEQGRIPKDLKRGVLSQDGVYNLLNALKEGTHEEAVSEG